MAFATSDDSAENTMETSSPNGGQEDHGVERSNGTPTVDDDGTDELVKKRKLDDVEQDSDSAQNMSPTKKVHLEKEIREQFPDLEKFWSTVEQDPNDFTAWTHLLQYVDQVSDKTVASEAYDAFLQKYPYCYGYWKKYADYTKKRGSSLEVQQIFNRGLNAIPLSVDLWIHFVTYIKSGCDGDNDLIRSKFEQGIATCGLEFRSDKLWELYVQWETELNNLQNTMRIWDQMISTPTQSLKKHFEKIVDFINEHEPIEILEESEYTALSSEIDDADDTSKLRDKIIERRTEMYERTIEEVKIRAGYEDGIKRPYFHVKPVEKNQLRNWSDYLEFEIEKGDRKRIITLFERCLIACAMYAEYWDKYLQFLQSHDSSDVEKIQEVFNRVTKIHHPKIYKFNLDFAAFEEAQGNLEKASAIYEELQSSQASPALPVYHRYINYQRRINNPDKCIELFDKFIQECQNKSLVVHMTIKYARFIHQCQGSYTKAVELLKSKLEGDEEATSKFLMALVDMGMHSSPVDMDLILYSFDYGIKKFEKDNKVTFARRKVEFLESYTDDIKTLKQAEYEFDRILKTVKPDEKPEPTATTTAKAHVQEIPKATAAVVSNQPSGYYDQESDSRYSSSEYGQYGQGQYGGSQWNSGPPGPSDGGYGQSYVNQPTAWNSFYA